VGEEEGSSGEGSLTLCGGESDIALGGDSTSSYSLPQEASDRKGKAGIKLRGGGARRDRRSVTSTKTWKGRKSCRRRVMCPGLE